MLAELLYNDRTFFSLFVYFISLTSYLSFKLIRFGVGIVSRLRAGPPEESCFESRQGQEIFLFIAECPNQFWGLPSFLFSRYRKLILRG